MWRGMITMVLVLAMPAVGSAGPLKDAAEKAARDLALVQREETRSRGRFWTGIALISGGGLLAVLGGLELRDDSAGSNGDMDADDSVDVTDSDGWGNKAMLGGGIAAATIGGVLLLTGRSSGGPVVSVRPGHVAVRHTVRF